MKRDGETIITSIFNAKTIIQGGAVLISLVLSWTIYKILTNDLSHLNASISRQADIQEKTNLILIDNAKAIEANTEVLRSLIRK